MVWRGKPEHDEGAANLDRQTKLSSIEWYTANDFLSYSHLSCVGRKLRLCDYGMQSNNGVGFRPAG